MLFSELSQYFEKLETTSSRLALIDILAQLYKNAPADEIPMIIYLTQGRVGPFFSPVEIGMAEKTVASAVADAYGSTKEAVLEQYKIIGDLGKVSEMLNQVQHDIKNRLTVKDVFEILTQIANVKGEGTVEKRLTLLSDLLKKVDPISAKHLVRIPLGTNRLGIGDPTVLDGLALGILGDRGNRKLLEKAYNETSDLGLIGETLKRDGLEAVQKLKITVGRPIRSELCERLPNPEKVIEKMIEVDAQFKYDGFRVQIHKDGDVVSMFSRNLESMTHMFPEIIEGTLRQVKAKTAILDTEALAYNPESEEFLPFQETTKRRRKHNITEVAKQLPLRAFVFDLLYADGKSYIDEPLTKRLEKMREIVESDPSSGSGKDILIPSETRFITEAKALSTMLEDAISRGLEGVVVKRVDSLYEAGGRNFNWVKLKRHSSGELQDTIDCVVLGYIVGKGKRTAFGAGALLVGVYDSDSDEFVTVSKIGTGLSDEEWREIHKRADKIKVSQKPARVNSLIEPSEWVKPEIVIEVLADEITRSPSHTAGKKETKGTEETDGTNAGYALRFPRLVSFRDHDKKAEDATTVKELIDMFGQQGKQ